MHPEAPKLSEATLDRGVRLLGTPQALHGLFNRLHAGKGITIGVLGASVAQNAGCLDQPGKRCMGYRGIRNTPVGFAIRLLRHINHTWPAADHRINNSALDGTGADHIARCIVGHMPMHTDVVIVEWGSMALHTVMSMPSMERVERVLLSRPSPPLVLHLSIHEWCSQRMSPRKLYRVGDVLLGSLKNWVFPDTPWAAVEDESTRIARYYGQASVSVHAALAPHVLSGETGFDLEDITGVDCLHPVNGRFGIDYVEQLLVHWFDRAHRLWQYVRSERRDLLYRGSRGARSLPPCLHQANADDRADSRCYAFTHETTARNAQYIMARVEWCSHSGAAPHALSFASRWSRGAASQAELKRSASQTVVIRHDEACWSAPHGVCPQQMEHTSHGRPGSKRDDKAAARVATSQAAYQAFIRSPPKHWFYCHVSLGERKRKISSGVVALVPGVELRARVDAIPSRVAEVRVEHLVSYEGMGMVQVACLGGCRCAPQVIDAHKVDGIRNVSIFDSYSFSVHGLSQERQHGRQASCEFVLTVLEHTRSSGHKFKVRTITLTSQLPTGSGAEVGDWRGGGGTLSLGPAHRRDPS